MDEELQNLEAELSRLRPIAVRPAVQVSVARRLKRSGRTKVLLRFAWVALPCAAAVALLLVNRPYRPRTTAVESPRVSLAESDGREPAFRAVAAENLLIGALDEGLVLLADGTPARRVREAYVDTIVWKNSATDASLRWSVPREQVRVVPVSVQ